MTLDKFKHFLAAAGGGAVVCSLFLTAILILNPSILSRPKSALSGGSAPCQSVSSGRHSSFYASVPDAAEKITPSVVFIDTKGFAEVSQTVPNIFGVPMTRTHIMPKEGSGSGLVIDGSGLILTNDHVVSGASEIHVTFSDNQTYPAVIKGEDPISDIALIKVDGVAPEKLSPAELADSDSLRIGEPVIAVGSPFNFQQTVTLGVISGRGRNLSDQSKDFQDLLQTDAAINPGNSGGPLVNLEGEVVGINTAIIPYAQGIGFAIPINTVKNIYAQLASSGKVTRSYIGVSMQDLNPRLAAYLGFSGKGGAVILGIDKGAPGDEAGLRPRDIIINADGRKISSCDDLRHVIRNTKPGDILSLKVWRDCSSLDINVKTGGR